MTRVSADHVVVDSVFIDAKADSCALLWFDVHGGRDRFLQGVVLDIVGAHSIANDQVVAKIEASNVLALQAQAQGVDGYACSKGLWAIDGWEEQTPVMVDVIPVVHWRVHFPGNDAKPVPVFVLQTRPLNAHLVVCAAVPHSIQRANDRFA